ncbi:hypothetical protein L195_g047340, partial [Trifolium pratense]
AQDLVGGPIAHEGGHALLVGLDDAVAQDLVGGPIAQEGPVALLQDMVEDGDMDEGDDMVDVADMSFMLWEIPDPPVPFDPNFIPRHDNDNVLDLFRLSNVAPNPQFDQKAMEEFKEDRYFHKALLQADIDDLAEIVDQKAMEEFTEDSYFQKALLQVHIDDLAEIVTDFVPSVLKSSTTQIEDPRILREELGVEAGIPG